MVRATSSCSCSRDRTADLPNISWRAPIYCPDGSHLAMYDDQATYFDGVINFIRSVEQGALRSE